ncbi:MAG: metal-sensitive transcriptional regulator [Oscillospiraceae bacterium]|nr:metal-sensitive transcriptional regulator [Oscillospiraceae bacterium]
MGCNHCKDVIRRLSRIEGQIKGIKEMIAEGRECEDIIMQLSAVNSAVSSAARVILTEHLEHCVVQGIKDGNEAETIETLKTAIDQFAKMK